MTKHMTKICMKQWSAVEAGIKVNSDKCIIKSNCNFFGNLYTTEGAKPDPKKVEAIKQM